MVCRIMGHLCNRHTVPHVAPVSAAAHCLARGRPGRLWGEPRKRGRRCRPIHKESRPRLIGRIGGADGVTVAARMIPIPNGSAWPRENDSHSQDLRHPGDVLRMIPILTREVLFENDSHYHRQKAL